MSEVLKQKENSSWLKFMGDRRRNIEIPKGLEAYGREPLIEKGSYSIQIEDNNHNIYNLPVIRKGFRNGYDLEIDQIMVEEWPKMKSAIEIISQLPPHEQESFVDQYSKSNPIWWYMRENPMSAWVIDLAVTKGKNFLDPDNSFVLDCPKDVREQGSLLGFSNPESLKVLNMLKLRKAVSERNEEMTTQLVKIIENKMEKSLLSNNPKSILGGDLAAGKSIYFMLAMNELFQKNPGWVNYFGDEFNQIQFHHIAADRDPRVMHMTKVWAEKTGLQDFLIPKNVRIITGQTPFREYTKMPDYIVSSGLGDYFESSNNGKASKKGRFYGSMRKSLTVGGDYVNFNILNDPRIVEECSGLMKIFKWEPMYTVSMQELIVDHLRGGGFYPDEIIEIIELDSGIGGIVAKKKREECCVDFI